MSESEGRTAEQDRALDLLEATVHIPSPSGEERAVSEFLVSEMRDRGFEAQVDEAGNAVGKIGSGPTQVLLLGHIDTVPGFIPVRRVGDELWGRGSVDATGPFCAFLLAAARVGATHGDALTITVVGAVEEEVASSKGAHHAYPLTNPDFIVVGEPSGWDAVTLGYKGRLGLRYSVRQAMAHGAGQDPSAADRGFGFFRKLVTWVEDFNAEKKIFQRLDMKVTQAHTTDDPLEDGFDFVADLRTPVDFPAEELRAFCLAAAEEAGGTVTVTGEVEAVRAPKNTPLVRAFLKTLRAQGAKPRFKVKTGTSDMNLAPQYHPGIPVVTYGPGDSSLDHAPDERASMTDFLKGIEVVAGVLTALAGEAGKPA